MSSIRKYKKKPIEVEACQLTHESVAEIIDWSKGKIKAELVDCLNPYVRIRVVVVTSTGNHEAVEGDWIVKGINGEFYAIPEKRFFQLYDKVATNESSNGVITW